MKLAFITGVFDDYRRLDTETREDFNVFFESFKTSKYEVIAKNRYIFTTSMNDTYSIVVGYFHRFDLYLLIKILPHIEAIRWITNHNVSVENSKNIVYISSLNIHSEGLFQNVSNMQLLEIGVPLEILHLIRNIKSIDELEEYENELNANTYIALIALANNEDVNEIVKLFKQDHLFKNNKSYLNSKATNMIYIDSNTNFDYLYTHPYEKWSITLSDEQNRLTNKDYIGPARLLGAAGSGKSVIALKRAKRLVHELEENERLLVTTFTKNLLSDLHSTLCKICNEDELKYMNITNTDALFHDLFYEVIHDRTIDYNHTLFKEAYNTFNDFPFEYHTCLAEWEKVVEANEAYTQGDYLFAPHTSRPDHFSMEDKLKIWEVFELYIHLMEERKVYDKEYAYYYLNKYLIDTYKGEYFYKYIIIDECQDLSMSELKLIRTLAGRQHKNDIYIVGDERQRIYLKKATLDKCNIHIDSREEHLTTCYRTTNAILQYALKIVNEIEEDHTSISVNLGKDPEIHEFESFEEEAGYLYDKITELHSSGVAYKEICIVLKQNASISKYIEYLEEREIDTYQLSGDDLDYNMYEAVRLTTIHRVKGLEFDYIFLAEMNQDVIPGDYDYKDPIYKYLVNQQKCLLYVALTRAKKEVFITSNNELSSFIPIKSN